MAYMTQEHKARIQAQLKRVIPAGWKWSLSVRHHSTLVLTIQSATMDLIGEWHSSCPDKQQAAEYKADVCARGYLKVNEYYLDRQFSGKAFEIMRVIKSSMNLDNHDNSDPQTDYFDVGHYISINLGRWNKPFVCTALQKAA